MRQPYAYSLSGHSGIRLTYVPRGVGARRQLTYQDSSVAAIDVNGSAVKAVATPAGQLITVMLHLVPDLEQVDFSFFVPNVELPDDVTSLHIESIGLTVRHRTALSPKEVSGQIDTYRETPLRGVATDQGIHPFNT